MLYLVESSNALRRYIELKLRQKHFEDLTAIIREPHLDRYPSAEILLSSRYNLSQRSFGSIKVRRNVEVFGYHHQDLLICFSIANLLHLCFSRMVIIKWLGTGGDGLSESIDPNGTYMTTKHMKLLRG